MWTVVDRNLSWLFLRVPKWRRGARQRRRNGLPSALMIVERLKYTIWAADKERAVNFYSRVFGAEKTRENSAVTELSVGGGVIAIHGGGEGKQTWTGLTFQVADVVAGAKEVQTEGGLCAHDPQPEDGEEPHLAMCEDCDGNQFMLTRRRGDKTMENLS